jgi:CRP/FNR family cyclic AMP-dependent transcriptional regulator
VESGGLPIAGFWSRLTTKQRDELVRIGARVWFEADAVILSQGARDRHLVVLMTGAAKVITSSVAGSERMVELCGPGMLLGEVAALTAAPRGATVRALQRASALVINQAEFDGAVRADPALRDHLVQALADRLRLANQRMAEASVPSMLPRLTTLLVSLSEQLGGGESPLVLPISQTDLASLAATSEASVARAIRTLRTMGLVRTGRRRMVLLDLPTLRRYADEYHR